MEMRWARFLEVNLYRGVVLQQGDLFYQWFSCTIATEWSLTCDWSLVSQSVLLFGIQCCLFFTFILWCSLHNLIMVKRACITLSFAARDPTSLPGWTWINARHSSFAWHTWRRSVPLLLAFSPVAWLLVSLSHGLSACVFNNFMGLLMYSFSQKFRLPFHVWSHWKPVVAFLKTSCLFTGSEVR